jgi:hypothetical protein
MTVHRNTMSFVATTTPKAAAVRPELDPTPRLLTPPELIGREHEHVVIRHDDDTDESYASRCELAAMILGAAPKS